MGTLAPITTLRSGGMRSTCGYSVALLIFGALTVLAAFLATELMFGRRDLSMAVGVLVAV